MIRAVSLPCFCAPVILHSLTLQSDFSFFFLLKPLKVQCCAVSTFHPLPHGNFKPDLVVRAGRRGVDVYAVKITSKLEVSFRPKVNVGDSLKALPPSVV